MAVRTVDTAKSLSTKQKKVGLVVGAVVFTVVEAWALVVVLADIRAGGMDRIALAVALAGCVVAVIDAWQNIRARRTESPSSDDLS